MHQTEIDFTAVPPAADSEGDISSPIERLASLVAFIMEVPLVVAGGGIEAQHDRLVADARALRSETEGHIAAEHARRIAHARSAEQVIAARCTRLVQDAALARISSRLEQVVAQYAHDYVLQSLLQHGAPQPRATVEDVGRTGGRAGSAASVSEKDSLQ